MIAEIALLIGMFATGALCTFIVLMFLAAPMSCYTCGDKAPVALCVRCVQGLTPSKARACALCGTASAQLATTCLACFDVRQRYPGACPACHAPIMLPSSLPTGGRS